MSVVETAAPSGMTLAGEKVQLDAAGNPLQPNVTGEAMPSSGFMVIVNVAVCPALMVALCGDASTVKFPRTDNRTSSTIVGDVA